MKKILFFISFFITHPLFGYKTIRFKNAINEWVPSWIYPAGEDRSSIIEDRIPPRTPHHDIDLRNLSAKPSFTIRVLSSNRDSYSSFRNNYDQELITFLIDENGELIKDGN